MTNPNIYYQSPSCRDGIFVENGVKTELCPVGTLPSTGADLFSETEQQVLSLQDNRDRTCHYFYKHFVPTGQVLVTMVIALRIQTDFVK